jgi:hypothetical protein
MHPEINLDKMQECDDIEGARLCPGRFADEQEVEEFETYRVALGV